MRNTEMPGIDELGATSADPADKDDTGCEGPARLVADDLSTHWGAPFSIGVVNDLHFNRLDGIRTENQVGRMEWNPLLGLVVPPMNRFLEGKIAGVRRILGKRPILGETGELLAIVENNLAPSHVVGPNLKPSLPDVTGDKSALRLSSPRPPPVEEDRQSARDDRAQG